MSVPRTRVWTGVICGLFFAVCNFEMVALAEPQKSVPPTVDLPINGPSNTEFKILLNKALAGDAQSQLQLATSYSQSKYVSAGNNLDEVEEQLQAAAFWFSRAAAQGQPDAVQFLVNRLAWDPEFGGYEAQARSDLFDAARSSAAGQAALGMNYLNGHLEHSQATTEALTLLNAAALRDEPMAQMLLGSAYIDGMDGVPRDQERGVAWLRSAATSGSELIEPVAAFYLAEMYATGERIPEDQAEAAKWYRQAAGKGIAQAQYALATMLYSGDGIEPDKPEAARWLRKVLESKSDSWASTWGAVQQDAANDLAAMLANGDGVPANRSEALQLFNKSARRFHAVALYNFRALTELRNGRVLTVNEAVRIFDKQAASGNAEAMYWLSQMYDFGIGVEPDDVLASDLLQRAAESGALEAQFTLALEPWNRIDKDSGGVSKWKQKAVASYLPLAEAGDAEAQYKLAVLLPSDSLTEAAAWAQKSAQQGHTDAQRLLADFYYGGKGVTASNAKSIYWLEKVAENIDTYLGYTEDSQIFLMIGNAYRDGNGVARDYATAAKWYRLAAEQNLSVAAHSLGLLYLEGDGVHQSTAEAARWFKIAVDTDRTAMVPCRFLCFELGELFTQGKGVARDEAEGARYFRMAALNGERNAQINIGLAYETGKGITQDYRKAVRWYREAADSGSSVAQVYLANMYNSGLGVEQDPIEAVRRFRMAAEQGDAFGQFGLALAYNEGEGVPENFAEAMHWYLRSAKQGLPEAQHNLGLMLANGEGVKKNLVEAYNWVNLAAAGGYDGAVRARESLRSQMTPAQIVEAQKLSAQFVSTSE